MRKWSKRGGIHSPVGRTYTAKKSYDAGKKSGCFIATASYGEDSEEVEILRRWRDEKLYHNLFGRLFVRTYYGVSPPIANFISKKPFLQRVVRKGLFPIKELVK